MVVAVFISFYLLGTAPLLRGQIFALHMLWNRLLWVLQAGFAGDFLKILWRNRTRFDQGEFG
jgi:hypothetical protein